MNRAQAARPLISRSVVRWLGVTGVSTSGRMVQRAILWVQDDPTPPVGFSFISDAEDVGLARLALDIGREVLVLVGVVALAMIAVRPPVPGDVEDAPALAREVRSRSVRRVAVEEDDVAGLGRHRAIAVARQRLVGERLPF